MSTETVSIIIFRSDCRQTLILFSTSDSSPTSSSSIGTCMILRSSWICPREKNEKHQENYAQPTRTFWATLSPEYSGSSLVFQLGRASLVPRRAWIAAPGSSSVLSLLLSSRARRRKRMVPRESNLHLD